MSSNSNNDFHDDDFQVLGANLAPKTQTQSDQSAEGGKRNPRKWLIVMISIVAGIVLLIGVVLCLTKCREESKTVQGNDGLRGDVVVEVEGGESQVIEEVAEPDSAFVESHDSSVPSHCVVRDTIVDGVSIQVFHPVNADVSLRLGKLDLRDSTIVLVAQAADIRKDNGKVVGSFVYKGEVLAGGVKKSGFCAIIDGKTYLGMSQSTSLFETATERDGYFFRQYPLVMSGEVILNKPEGQSQRKALCKLKGAIVVVATLDKVTYQKFSEILAAIGVNDAISLVGGGSFGWGAAVDGSRTYFGSKASWTKKNVNYIVWRKRDVKPE